MNSTGYHALDYDATVVPRPFLYNLSSFGCKISPRNLRQIATAIAGAKTLGSIVFVGEVDFCSVSHSALFIAAFISI